MASLTEVFGQDFSYYPMEPAGNQNGQNFQKKKKKNIKQKSYGHQMPPTQPNRFSSNEPKRNINIGTLDSLDDQYLAINGMNGMNGVNSEYGPTDYNIKPQDVQEYMFQLNDPNQTIKGAQIHNATNYIDTYGSIPTNSPSNTPGNSNVFRPNNLTPMPSDSNIVEEYDNDTDSDDDIDTSSRQKQNQKQKQNQMPKSSQMMDMKMMEFNQKLDAIMEKLKHFDEPAQENIHDIILFVIFGCFVIFILDSVYRVGKMTL